MYKQNSCAAIKVGGKVLREVQPGNVILPFGSEYSVYFKNMSTNKASLKVEIDGEDVLNGRSLIVHPNSYIDLERFYKTNNKFKFIKMTDKIADHRGVKAEDGIVRLEWQYEYEWPKVSVTTGPTYIANPATWIYTNVDGNIYNYNTVRNAPSANGEYTSRAATVVACAAAPSNTMTFSASVSNTSDSGFTTLGGESDQKFTTGSIGYLDPQKNSICFYLRGTDKKEVTVKDKLSCSVCGTLNSYKAKFCMECGTAVFRPVEW